MDSPGATGAARAPSPIEPFEELELLRTLMRKAPTGIAVFDLDLRFLLVNERLAEINGLPVAAHLGRALDELLPALAPEARRVLARLLATGEPVLDHEFSGEIPGAPGRIGYRSESWYPIADRSGRIHRVAAIVEETTARREAEAALRHGEERFRTIAESLPGLVFVHDSDARNTFVNRGFCDFAGRAADGLLGHGYRDLVSDDDVQAARPAWQRARAGKTPFEAEFRVRRHDGEWRWHLVRSVPQQDAGGAVVQWFATALDITERRRAADDLRAQTDQLESLLTAAPIGLAFFDREHRYLQVNSELAAINGIAVADHLGRTIGELLPVNAPAVTPIIDEVFATGIPARDFQVAGETQREPGVTRHWLCGFYPVFGKGGAVAMVGAWVVEITAMRRTEDKLREADRRKDEYLATLAHELRNPLAPISNGVTLLRRHVGNAPQARQVLDIMARQVGHIVRLIDDLLDASRVATGKLRLVSGPIDLVQVVHSAVDATHALFAARGVALHADLPPAPVVADGDGVRLAQVFTNVLSNAAKFTPAGGRVTLRLEARAGSAAIVVTDSGIGIPRGQLENIFELFSQVGPVAPDARIDHGGLGIGLNLAKRLVELHGGSIRASSPGAGGGSTFEVVLPVRADHPPASPAAAPAPVASDPSLQILVVDDNRDAADALTLLLVDEGHSVVCAYDGATAVGLAGEQPPDVAFVDLSMPGMSGFEVARAMRGTPRVRPLRIVAVTGLGDELTRERVRDAGFDAHLVKPVSRDAVLTEVVRRTAPAPRV